MHQVADQRVQVFQRLSRVETAGVTVSCHQSVRDSQVYCRYPQCQLQQMGQEGQKV